MIYFNISIPNDWVREDIIIVKAVIKGSVCVIFVNDVDKSIFDFEG